MDTNDTVLQSESAAATVTIGHRLARQLDFGDVAYVRGDLGSGKSTLIRGALRELGVKGPIASPTYVVGSIYDLIQGQVAHLDLYRVENPKQEDPGLLDPYIGADVITFIEWPERGIEMFSRRKPRLRIQLEHQSHEHRTITISRVA